MVEIPISASGGVESGNVSEAAEKKDPFTVYAKSEHPDIADFFSYELDGVNLMLPDYDGPVPERHPWSFMPDGFWEIKKMEPQLHSGEAIIVRSDIDESRMTARREELKSRNVDINTHMQTVVFPTGNEAYVLRFDEFPGNVPHDTQHYNLWLKNPDTPRNDLVLAVADCLRFLNVTASEAVLFEKKKKARERTLEGEFIIGISPTVKDIRHLHLYAVRKTSQKSFIRY